MTVNIRGIFTLVFICFLTIWSISFFNNPNPEGLKEGIKLIAEDSIPWYIEPIKWISELPSPLNAFIIIGFIGLLKSGIIK